MNIYGIGAIVILAALMSVYIKHYKPEISILIGLATVCAVFIAILPDLIQVFKAMSNISVQSALVSKYTEPLFKALGIAIIFRIASAACKDCGEYAMGVQLEFAGNIAILIVSLPLINQLLAIVTELLK